jgi:hypothetical protein
MEVARIFLGDLTPVHLDRHLAQLELCCDLLVRAAGDDECVNFPFARRQ